MDKKLEWNVLIEDFNTHKINPYNILGTHFMENFKKEKIESLEDLKEFIDQWARYHYWSRTEYEIMVGGLFAKIDEFKKIDVYYQISMNLDRIVEYVNKELGLLN